MHGTARPTSSRSWAGDSAVEVIHHFEPRGLFRKEQLRRSGKHLDIDFMRRKQRQQGCLQSTLTTGPWKRGVHPASVTRAACGKRITDETLFLG